MSRIAAAIRLREIGRPREALEQLLRELADDPRSVSARLELVWVHIALRDKESAQRVADEALELEPDNPVAMHAKANAHGGFGENARALPFVDRALARAPRTSVFHSYRAALCLNLGQVPEALASVDRALELDANSAYSLELRIRVLRALHRNSEALAATRAALALHPELPKLLQQLGELALIANDASTAGSAFRAVLRQDPSRVDAKAGLVEALRKKSRVYRALNSFLRWSASFRGRFRTPIARRAMVAYLVCTVLVVAVARDSWWTLLALTPLALGIVSSAFWIVLIMLARFALPVFLVPVMFDSMGKHALKETVAAKWKRSALEFVWMIAFCILGALATRWPWLLAPALLSLPFFVVRKCKQRPVRIAFYTALVISTCAALIGFSMILSRHTTEPWTLTSTDPAPAWIVVPGLFSIVTVFVAMMLVRHEAR